MHLLYLLGSVLAFSLAIACYLGAVVTLRSLIDMIKAGPNGIHDRVYQEPILVANDDPIIGTYATEYRPSRPRWAIRPRWAA